MTTRAAGLLIFRHLEGTIEYLLLRASYGDKHWTPPKGHVDPGEDEWTTALRETCEEAGLSESDMEIYRERNITLRYQVRGSDKTVIYWLARLINPLKPITLSKEHTDYKWLQIAEAKNISGYEDFNKMLDNFHEQCIDLLGQI